MGYPGERASKINHREIVESEEVRAYLARCEKIPPQIDILNFDDTCIELSQISNQLDSHIERVVVVDGSYTEIFVDKQTIDHLDIKKLENCERFNFVMPMQNIRLAKKDFTTTFRETPVSYTH